MKIAIIDADLTTRKKHRFPNLACMKISAFYKENGNDVTLKNDYENLDKFDKVFISKVFTDTPIDEDVLKLENVEYGGTGFFFDKAANLPDEIEHHFPDYHLYDEYVNEKLNAGAKRSEFKEYIDYSIGYLTRGCFRKCEFCVNKKYNKVFKHSNLKEFYDETRPKICLLDDNFLGSPDWKEMLIELKQINKPIKFKQGLDERILTEEKIKMLCELKYDGQITFAFDKIEDYELIKSKLHLIRKYSDAIYMFYVLCGFESIDEKDIENTFKRIELLIEYRCLPYIMRFENYKKSKYKGIYVTLARWCNQQNFFKKTSFREFCELNLKYDIKSSMRYLKEFENEFPEIAKKYFDIKWKE